MKNIKAKLILCLKEIGFGLLQIFFSRIVILGQIIPVGLPFLFVRVFFHANIFSACLFYLISKAFLFFNINIIITTIYEIIIVVLYHFTKEFLKTNKTLILMYVFMYLANVLKLYFDLETIETLAYFAMNAICEGILVYYFYKLFKVYEKKIIFCRFSKPDYFMIFFGIFLLSFGIFSYGFISKFLCYFIINFAIVFFCKVLLPDKFLIFIVIFLLGLVVATENASILLYSILVSIILVELRDVGKVFFTIMSMLSMLAFTLILRQPLIINSISLFIALFIYALLPNRWLMQLANIFIEKDINYIHNFTNDNKIQVVKNKLLLMSNTLTSMQNSFKYLLIGKIDRNKACSELAVDAINNCCNNCEYFKSCFMGNIDKKLMFEELIKKSIDYGGISLNDLTNGIQSYCVKSNFILNEINKIAKLYISYEATMKSEDESKLVIANELQNFSSIFFNFSKMIDKFSKVNDSLSKILKDNLLRNMVDVKEVAIFENKSGIKSVNIISTNEQILKKEMQETIHRVIKNKVKVNDIKHIEYSGLSYVTFLPVSKIKATFSVSSKSKENQNGDNVVIQKLDEDRFFIAIADGMGHGEKANRISSMVLSLIKSLFEVGFEEDLVIQSVNKLLIPAGLDNFTTLDACVLDLENAVCTFIKLGSSVSILKHSNTSELISCESLPIGMIQNITPTIVKKQITVGDMIFIASDGIVDAFRSVGDYKNFINDSKIFDMKKYLDEIIADVEFQNQKHKDDMTIIGINLLKN